MLRNCEKIITPISSTTTNEWTQNHHLELDAPMPSPSPPANKAAAMDPLKCPRCDSSNTKFCYYNNYSLSQPRHFCKACKRYWTRGGTLRNVPVGGGCRKNKRSKRHPSSSTEALSSSSAASSAPVQTHEMDLSNPTRIHNPLFFNPIELNFPFSSFSSSTRVSAASGLDLHSQMNNPLGLGFSSGLGLQSEVMNNDFKPIQDAVNGATHNSILFGSSNLGSTSTMASFLASTLQHHGIKSPSNVPGLMQPYEDPGNPNPIDQINSSDPSSLMWNTTWFDPSNMGSSVPSLI